MEPCLGDRPPFLSGWVVDHNIRLKRIHGKSYKLRTPRKHLPSQFHAYAPNTLHCHPLFLSPDVPYSAYQQM